MSGFFFLLKNRECTTHLEGKRKKFIQLRALAAYLCYIQVWVSTCECGM